MPGSESPLKGLADRIVAASTPLALDAALLGDVRLAWWLGEMLGQTATLSTPVLQGSGDGWCVIAGTIDGGPIASGPATLAFFTSRRTGEHAPPAMLELLVTFDTPLADHPVADYAAPGCTYRSFLAAITLRHPQFVLSSYNFALEAAAVAAGTPLLVNTLGDHRPTLPPGMTDPEDGVTITGAALSLSTPAWGGLLADTDTWGKLSDLLDDAGRDARGLVGFDEGSGERWFEATFDLSADGLTLALPFTTLQASIVALRISGSLRAPGRRAPTVAIVLRLVSGAGGDTIDLVLEVPVAGGVATLAGSFDPPLSAVRWLGALAGQADLTTLLPEPLSALATAGIVEIEAALSLPSFADASMVATLEPADPWRLLDTGITIDVLPWIEVGFVHTGGAGTAPIARVGGVWTVGEEDGKPGATFDLLVDVETMDVTLGMRVGEALDVAALAGQIHVPVPDQLSLVDLEVQGNIDTGDYSFLVHAHTAGGLKLPVFDADLIVSDVAIEGVHNAAGLRWQVTGTLHIGQALAQVALTGASHENFALEARIDRVEVGEIIDDLLGGIAMPATLKDFAIADVVVSYQAGAKFTLTGGPSTPLTLLDGFRLTVDAFAVSRTPQGNSLDTLDLSLVLGDGDEETTIRMVRSATDTGSVFESDVTASRISLVALADGLLGMVGLNLPLPRDLLFVEDIACRYVSDEAGDVFSIGCKVSHGSPPGRELGAITFIAARAAPGDDGAPADWRYMAYVQVEVGLGFAELPVVGAALGSNAPELRTADIVICSVEFSDDDFAAMLAHAPTGAALPPATTAGHHRGANLGVTLEVAGHVVAPVVPLSGVVGTKQPPPLPSPVTAPTPATPPAMPGNDTTSWFDVGKQLGPLRVDRIGLRYQSGQLTLLFDAAMSLGPVGVGLMGLGLSSPIGHFDPSASLDGLSLTFDGAGVSVAGGLVRTGDDYAGEVNLTAAALSLVAIGRYSAHPEGLFLFGMLREPPIGGPPEFYIQGIAAGMGFNNRLKLPAGPADVAAFSLVQAAMPDAPAPLDTGTDLDQVLARVNLDTEASSGETWLAAGVQFSSFELIQSFALLSVEFGHSSATISLLGLSRAALPPDTSDPVALFEVALTASFNPSIGTLKVDGALTPRSYALSRDAHLTGGFGFYAWFKDHDGVSAGSFVYTMGGYHPRFAVPAHYPRPPRLGLSWQPSDELSVKGESYFALTPQCLMAGMAMQANWNSGPVSAWFDADADFLVYWKPFHYLAHIDTSLGASVTIDLWLTSITVTVHVGIGLDIAGPPFGGSADVDLDVISFVIRFGSDSNEAGFLDFATFRSTFLPGNSLLSFQPLGGLITDLTKTCVKTDDPRWILSPDNIRIRISSAMPAKRVAFADPDYRGEAPAPVLNADWTHEFAVAPMGPLGSKVDSGLRVVLERQGAVWDYYPAFAPVAVTRPGPASLWGNVTEQRPSSPNHPALVDNLLFAVELAPVLHAPDATDPVDLQNLRYDTDFEDMPIKFGQPETPPGYGAPVANGDTLTYTLPEQVEVTCRDHILSAIATPSDARAAIIASLRRSALLDADFDEPGMIDVAALAGGTVLDAWPRIRMLGETA